MLEWRELSNEGRLYAFTTSDAGRLCLGVVELDVGLRILSRIEGNYKDLYIGKRVFLKTEVLEDGRIFFCFRI